MAEGMLLGESVQQTAELTMSWVDQVGMSGKIRASQPDPRTFTGEIQEVVQNVGRDRLRLIHGLAGKSREPLRDASQHPKAVGDRLIAHEGKSIERARRRTHLQHAHEHGQLRHFTHHVDVNRFHEVIKAALPLIRHFYLFQLLDTFIEQ
jgi:hypothetical protein